MSHDPANPAAPQGTDLLLTRAATHLRAGGLLVLPTDTVYGIGTLASDAEAVTRLLAAKGRGRQMPPPVLVAGPDQLEGLVATVPPAARALMEAFWPGALTIILDAAPSLGWDLGETGGTLAVRMPDHPLALALLRQVGPLAVTSANHTGEPPATDATSGAEAFPGRVTPATADDVAGADILLLDGGPTGGPVPSTIVSLAGPHATEPLVIRDGLLERERVLDVAAPHLGAPSEGAAGPGGAR